MSEKEKADAALRAAEAAHHAAAEKAEAEKAEAEKLAAEKAGGDGDGDRRQAALLADFRRKAAEADKRAKALEAELAEHRAKIAEADKAKLAEEGRFRELAEKAQAEKAQAEQRAKAAEDNYRQTLIRAEFLDHARASGCRRPQEAFKLADHALLSISDDGAVLGATDAVNKLKEQVPELFGDPKLPPPQNDRGRPGGNANTLPPAKTLDQAWDNAMVRAQGK